MKSSKFGSETSLRVFEIPKQRAAKFVYLINGFLQCQSRIAPSNP